MVYGTRGFVIPINSPRPCGRGAGGEGTLPSPLVGEGLGVRAGFDKLNPAGFDTLAAIAPQPATFSLIPNPSP